MLVVCVCLVCLRLLGQLKALPGAQNDEQVDLAMELRECWTLTLRKELKGWCCPKEFEQTQLWGNLTALQPNLPLFLCQDSPALDKPCEQSFYLCLLASLTSCQVALPSLSQQLFSLSSGTHLRPVCSWRSTSMHRSGLPVSRALEQLGKFVITQVCKE